MRVILQRLNTRENLLLGFLIVFSLLIGSIAPNFLSERNWVFILDAAALVGIIALGHIGRQVARLAKAFGMSVLAVDELRGTKPARYVDTMLPVKQLRKLFTDSDFVVSCVPLTPKNAKLIGEKELQAMKKTAYLINISRGGIVDEEALIHALEEKWIAGAGLDVTVAEPLPPDSRLWDFDNVFITPHISGSMEDYVAQATGL